MNKTEKSSSSRRQFLTKSIPLCALSLYAIPHVIGSVTEDIDLDLLQDGHKFDRKKDKKFSNRELAVFRFRRLVRFYKHQIKEHGEEKTLEMIKSFTKMRSLEEGKRGAKRDADNSFKSFTKMFKQPNTLDSLSLEVVEDTDKVFEIKVTECLSQEVYKALKFDGKFGFACVCYGDYSYPESYNPKIKLKRDKTLMEGHDCCNHRYYLEG
ncbi:L-2-amino-thiazoline-4-carboxylic acid hydrolase [Bacteroidota bacterium]